MSEGLNKTLLKKFAVESRDELREKTVLKANIYGITKELSDIDRKTKGKGGFISNDNMVINTNEGSRTLSDSEKIQRTELIKKIQIINKEGRDGFDEVIEEVAYTWFNRFVALRYMEVNGFLPSRINILGSKDNTNTPEILTEAMNTSLPIDKDLVYKLKKDNKNEELYRYLIELQCSELNKTLPFIFEKVGHYAELLFPAGIIMSKFFRTLVDTESITEEDWSNVEIIGWLYQYYISKEKDRVIKAKKKYKKNEIPFATQLFTPDWIVRYMVQNSLGRYWVESHEDDSDLKENWEFYLENPEKEADFDEKIAPYINKDLNVEDIKCFDPACGSGHILVYMFDVLYEIYSKCGYSRGEIPMLIIEKNLYGLDIDMRAYQLACFAVIMKAMSYDKLLLRKIAREVDSRGEYIDLNIACVKETNILFEDETTTLHDNIAFLANEQSGEIYDKVKLFVESLKNANTFGSLTKVEGFDKEFLKNRLEEIKSNPATDIFSSKSSELWKMILGDLIKQSSIMEKTYDVLVTNPPYMGSKYMNPILTTFIKTNYKETKSDLFSAFIEYCFVKVRKEGQLGMITPFVWMFLGSYEKIRNKIVEEKNISSLIQLEYNSFPEACVPVCTFTLRNYNENIDGEYIKLSDFKGSDLQKTKTLEAIESENIGYRYTFTSSDFKNIPGYPIAYWLSDKFINIFRDNKELVFFAEPKQGMATADNEKFLRLWYEVGNKSIGFNCKDIEECIESKKKWFPHSKGGKFNKWYGNNEYVVDWYDDGKNIKNFKKAVVRNNKFYFKKGITWSDLTSSNFGARYVDEGFTFDTAGPTMFVKSEENINFILGCINSSVFQALLNISCQGMHYSNGVISKLPVPTPQNEGVFKKINSLVQENIDISRKIWDSKETSWEFEKLDIICMNTENKKIEKIVNEYNINNVNKLLRLKSN